MNEQVLPIDFYVNVSVSNDKLTATIHFTNCDENFKCTLAQLDAVLKANYIIYGIHQNVLINIANNPKEFLLSKTIVATGDTPIEGDQGYIKFLYELKHVGKKPMEMEDGSVDFKEVASINNVRKGELIAERFPATEGIHGKAVTGEVVFAKAGKEDRFKVGKNVVMDADKIYLFAAIDGMVTATDRDKINVFPIYEVNGDVDYNTGNIDFVGTIVIRGNVRTGFKVKAEGDIRIIGSVEGAELEAAGSIEISAGIIGQNKGLVKAAKNVKTAFIQEGIVEAGGDVIVSQSIMHSTIRAGKDVICQGVKGLIVGGMVQAGQKVAARTIGNSMATNTIIEVGVLPELRNEMIQLRTQLKLHMENLEKTDKALHMLDLMAATGVLTPEKVAMKIKLANSRKMSLEEQSQGKERILEIEKSLEDTEKARVEVASMMYGGTKIVIGRYTKFIKDPIAKVYFRLLDSDIVMMTK
ncbi:MAG: FapA family protein [Paenibacillaceae bacterium]